jgi:hypothetical protein
MSYTLTPVLVDLPKLRALMGSKDTALLQAVIKKDRSEMLNVDEIADEFFDDFKKEIKAEYKAFAAGDFSGVDLKRVYPDPPPDEEDDDPKLNALLEGVEKLDEDSPRDVNKFKSLLKDYFKDDGIEDEEDEENGEDEDTAVRETTTGAALVHLIMGGNTDPAKGYKYGYALSHLCEYIGTVPEHEAWCSIRYASVEAVDVALKRAGIGPKTFAVEKHLQYRGAPVAIPAPDDFPAIGYLTRDEARKVLALMDPAKLDAAIRKAAEDYRDWLETAIAELRGWLEACSRTGRDLICFYY